MTILHAFFVAAAIAAIAPRSRRLPLAVPIAALAAGLALALADIRFGRTIFTLIGAPSVTTLALLASRAVRRCWGASLLHHRDRSVMLAFLAGAAVAVYPAALGYLNVVDVYRLGFLAGAPVVLAVIGAVLVVRRQYRIAAVVFIALVALDLRLLPSVNVFDYVVDPLGGLFALGWIAVRLVKAVAMRRSGVVDPVDPAVSDTLEPA